MDSQVSDQPDLPPDGFPVWWEFCQRPKNDGQGAHCEVGDAGGWTTWGITYTIYKANAYQFGLKTDLQSFKALTQTQASSMARALYWEDIFADHMPPAVGMIWCDFHFTSGGGNKILQGSLGVAADGIVGAKTLAALRQAYAAGPKALLAQFTTARKAYYTSLGQPEFLDGWNRRAEDCLVVALELVLDTVES